MSNHNDIPGEPGAGGRGSDSDQPGAARDRAKILAHLRLGKTLTTLQALEKMGVLHPGGRVLELRKRGYNITTTWVRGTDCAGRLHRIGSYRLEAPR